MHLHKNKLISNSTSYRIMMFSKLTENFQLSNIIIILSMDY